MAKGEGSGGVMEWEFSVSRCKFTYRMDKYKVLLCSTGNYIQYPVINHNGKEYSSLCCIVGPFVYPFSVYQFASANPKLPIQPSPTPHPLGNRQFTLYVPDSISVS